MGSQHQCARFGACAKPKHNLPSRASDSNRRLIDAVCCCCSLRAMCRTECVVFAAARPLTSCDRVHQVATPNALRLLIDDDSQQTCRQNGTVAPREQVPAAYDPRPGKGLHTVFVHIRI